MSIKDGQPIEKHRSGICRNGSSVLAGLKKGNKNKEFRKTEQLIINNI